MRDGQVETVEAVVGHGLTLECHLPDAANASSAATVRWERWATDHGAGAEASESKPRTGESLLARRRRRRHHHGRRSRRLIHQGSALRFASISEEDEGLYRCVGSSSGALITDSDEGGRQLDDPRSLTLDPPDAVAVVSAINDTEQQSGVVTSPATTTTTTSGDDPGVSSASPVYGSFIHLRVQGKSIETSAKWRCAKV